MFGLNTFGFSAISEESKDNINSIIIEILNNISNKER